MRIGVLASHPIQYYSPVFRELANVVDLHVLYAHLQSPAQQAHAGYGVAFEWDRDLLNGYSSQFLANVAARPGVGTFNGCDTPSIEQVIEAGRFDAFVVTGWNLKCYWQAVMACRGRRVAVVARGDSRLGAGGPVRAGVRGVTHPFLLRYFDGFLVAGSRNRDYLLHYGISSARLFDSPHSVDVPWFAAAADAARGDRDSTRASIGASQADVILLFVGRLLDWKRPHLVVDAAARMRDAGVPVLAVFVGDGPQRPALESRARERGVRAYFAGFRNQSELPRWYVIGDILVLPSTSRETWGLVVNEAFACGVPAVVSDAVGCAPDMIQPGVTGEVFRDGEVAALADAVQRVLAGVKSEEVRIGLSRLSAEHLPAATAAGFVRAAQALARDPDPTATWRPRRPSPIPLLERLPW